MTGGPIDAPDLVPAGSTVAWVDMPIHETRVVARMAPRLPDPFDALRAVREPLAADVLRYIERRCECADGCWVWTGAVTSNRVPVVGLRCWGAKSYSAREIAWLASGQRRRRRYAFATPDCDPMCVRPEHQRYVPMGTRQRLAAQHGRMATGVAASLRNAKAAAKRGLAYSDEVVAAFRADYLVTGNARASGAKFGLKPRYAWALARGLSRRWASGSNPWGTST